MAQHFLFSPEAKTINLEKIILLFIQVKMENVQIKQNHFFLVFVVCKLEYIINYQIYILVTI